MALTKDQTDFIVSLAAMGVWSTRSYDLPVAGMVACACSETSFGTRGAYLTTGCPFNLQKPSNWIWPKCEVVTGSTNSSRVPLSATRVIAPFCIAKDLGDAARIFCEWIVYFPNKGARDQVLAHRSNAKEFARNLPKVAFGAPLPGKPPGSQGDEYAAMVDTVSPYIPFALVGGP
jgi:hypothetical protein